LKTVTYSQIKNLATDFAGRTPDNLPTSEATMLQTFMAAELADIWNKEAWPELCDNVTAVTVSANVFSKNEGAAGEMGDILGLWDADPRSTSVGAQRVEFVEGDGQVRVLSGEATVWVDFQDPLTDLLSSAYSAASALNAVTLPARFRIPLAMRGASMLLANEDPSLSAKWMGMADMELARQSSRIVPAWWRQSTSRF
jgi:hypothetical protein